MATFDSAFELVKTLVEDFKGGAKHYLSPQYQEAEARKDFIDKFLIALGWDVHHDTQKNPYEQEVKVERGVTMSGAQKRADYSFTLAPNYRDPKFFVEAKKPSHDLYNADYYFQTIRYGWHKATPIVVLTDFEEFHILDCRFSPDIKTILNRKVKQYHYLDYADKEKFAEIYWLLSREAVANNSLEKFAESMPKPRGKAVQKALFALEKHQTIDVDFLNEIEEKREILAKALKRNDESLDSEQLTEATQKIIDRLVFIRFLEDKLIEQEHHVHAFGEKGSAWDDFTALCRKLDAKYNGIVFKKNFIDSDTFKGPVDSEFHAICQDICHLNSRFLYNEIPIHILGSIYERFLGKVVHATDHRVKIEEKPEVRKAGGVFYTPKYIVDYIVQNTVGKLIEGKTPEQIAKLRFADIACGSGSFLIGVLDCLIDYHNKYYQANPDKAKKDGCHLHDGIWILSIKQKQNILRNNIYGVDIDAQAVEVTQLSLSLKMLEDETTATANEMQVLFHERILPDMSKNIVCGNSLIGTDILSQNLFAGDEERKLNPMDFEHAFPHIFRRGTAITETEKPKKKTRQVANAKATATIFDAVAEVDNETEGFEQPHLKKNKDKSDELHEPATHYGSADWGFDAIVGNPPYVRPHRMEEEFKKYLWKHYKTFVAKSDLYSCFMERAITLTKENGLLSYIVPQTWTSLESFYEIRKLIIKDSNILKLTQLPKKVFKNATVETCVFLFEKNSKNTPKRHKVEVEKLNEAGSTFPVREFNQSEIENSHLYNFQLYGKTESKGLLKKLSSYSALDEFVEFKYGFKTADDEKFLSTDKKSNEYKPFIRSAAIGRYFNEPPFEFVWYRPDKMTAHRKTARPGEAERFENEKIIVARMGKSVVVTYDSGGLYVKDAMLLVKKSNLSLLYLAGLLNSNLINYYYKEFFVTIDVLKNALLSIPIKSLDFSNKAENAYHDKMVQLVQQILQSKKEISNAKTDKDKTYYERRVSALDSQIDSLVYELYGLTEEEIGIVEGKSIA